MTPLILYPHNIALYVQVLFGLAITYQTWKRRHSRGASAVLVLALGGTLWSFGCAVALHYQDIPHRLFWAKVQHIGIAVIPLSTLILTLQYTRLAHWLHRKNPLLWLTAAVPFVSLVLIWSEPAHGLIWRDISVVHYGPLPALKLSYGPLFWCYTTFNYVLVLCCAFLLFRAAWRSAPLQRRQLLILLCGMLMPLCANVLYLGHWTPFPYIDITPSAYCLSGLLFVWGLLRYRMLELIPIAREQVLEHMVDPVFVTNLDYQIIDLNPAAQQLTEASYKRSTGQSLTTLFPSWFAQERNVSTDKHPFLSQLLHHTAEQDLVYDLKTVALYDERDEHYGYLLVLRDMTAIKQAEQELHRLAVTDPLTGSFNRRHCFELAEHAFQQATRYQRHLALLMLDIDHFKKVNDNFGHSTGDLVLKDIAALLQYNIRSVDILGRYGGEEFLLLMPETSPEHAEQAAQRLLDIVRHHQIDTEHGPLTVTFSIGIANLDPTHPDLDKLIDIADQAMYVAKESGRNQVIRWPSALE